MTLPFRTTAKERITHIVVNIVIELCELLIASRIIKLMSVMLSFVLFLFSPKFSYRILVALVGGSGRSLVHDSC